MCPRNAGRISMAERMAGLPSPPVNSRWSGPSDAWLNPCEHLDVSSAAGACIGHNIETGQQLFAVGAHGHDAAAFSAGSAGFRTINRLRKVQVQFVDALL